MNKWYQPFGLLLLAAMMGDLSGCAQTGSWLTKKSSKKTDDEKVASSDKKPNAKTKKASSTKELADAKSDSKNGKTAKTASSKATDADRDKIAAADRAKKAKPPVDRTIAKADASKSDSDSTKLDVMKNDATKHDGVVPANAKSSKPAPAKPKADEDLDSFLAQSDTPTNTPKRTAAKKSAFGDPEQSSDVSAQSKRNVVPVKKEVARDEDDSVDWASVKPTSESKPAKTAKLADSSDEKEAADHVYRPGATKTAKIADSSNEEWDSSAFANDKSKTGDTKEASFEQQSEEPASIARKTEAKKDAGRGMQDLCPQARGELRELLASLHPDDPESLKQGLHRIGQMQIDGGGSSALEKDAQT